MLDFNLPEIGENITSGTVIKVAVSANEKIAKDQTLLELETEKAAIEVPSPCDGTIAEILVKEGEEIQVGQTIFKIDSQAQAPLEQKPQIQESKEIKPSSEPEPKPNATEQPATPATTASHNINLTIIGGGPGGYVAAFLAADLGMKVTLIDMEDNLGGVCLLCGCIPSKALLHVSKIISESREAKEIGVEFSSPTIHIDKIRDWKNKGVISKLTSGLSQLVKQRKINYIQGRATLLNSNKLQVVTANGKEELTFDKAIIAAGSKPVSLPFAPESKRVLNSKTALELEDVPEKLLVIGGGYIGLELGTVYHALGSKVSVVEMLPSLLMGADNDLANVLKKRITGLFDEILLNTKVTKIDETKKGVSVTFEDKDGKSSSQEFDKILVAIGRKPNSENLGLENTDVEVNEKGFVVVNAQRQTTDPNIYAIGDIAGEPMLAHKASHEGRVAVEAISGLKVAFEPMAIPAVVFTDPEIAWCGLTETQAKEQNRDVKIVKFPWGASGRAIAMNRTDGLTKLIIDSKTERVLGIGIVGVCAGEMISEGVLAIEMGTIASDLKLSIHPHPTLSETYMEAAESFYGHSTHIYKPKKN